MDYFKGTKGEWERDGSAVVVNGVQIADIYCSRECSVSEMNDMDISEMVANTKLISAAPELLDAAIRSWMLLSDIPEEFMDNSIEKTVNKLESSISKALGYKIGNK